MDLGVSVIVCAHNPRPDYLARVLAALVAQTLPRGSWELLVIDNASAEPLAGRCDLAWHPNGRQIREDELGLTPARLRGIAEARAGLIVFVDDDNVLAADYLEQAVAIAGAWPLLGAWGGSVAGAFEEAQPAPWVQPLLPFLGLREVPATLWSNNPEDWTAQPCGAGLCLRAEVARTYAAQVAAEPWRRRLGRIGTNLTSGEDNDLVHTSRALGLGFGNFPQLKLTHLIPARRLAPDYVARLMHGVVLSGTLLRYYQTGVLPPRPRALRTLARYLLTWAVHGRQRARVYRSCTAAVGVAVRLARSTPLTERPTRSNGLPAQTYPRVGQQGDAR